METNDLVSIIIPCYNQAQYLEESVQSAIDQTYPNIEIIIVNDGSTDNTEEIALSLQEKYPEKIQFVSQKNSGVSEARNNAIKQSKGEFILPLDGDDRLDVNYIETCLKILLHYNEDIVYTDLQCFGARTDTVKRKPFKENHILYKNLPPPTSLYKRKVWEITGGYNTNMKEGYEDWEFWINAYKHNFSFYYLPETLFYYRTKEVSRDTEALQKYHKLLINKIILNHPELYTSYQVQEAINHLKHYEKKVDIYFYSPINTSKERGIQTLMPEVINYLNTHKLKKKQIINKVNIALYSIELFKNEKSIIKIYQNINVDYLLFYAPIRYIVDGLICFNTAYKKNIGLMKTDGDQFPFVHKNSKRQLIATKNLVNYKNALLMELDNKDALIKNKNKLLEKQNRIINDKNALIKNKNILLEKQDTIIQEKNAAIKNKNILLEKQNRIINDKNALIKNKNILLEKQDTIIQEFKEDIQNVINFSIKKYPFKKYKAYKKLCRHYYKTQ